MNKKLIAAILAATTALSAAPFALAENDENTNDKVEIAFNVGDSILKINGIETEVETPYVTEKHYIGTVKSNNRGFWCKS